MSRRDVEAEQGADEAVDVEEVADVEEVTEVVEIEEAAEVEQAAEVAEVEEASGPMSLRRRSRSSPRTCPR